MKILSSSAILYYLLVATPALAFEDSEFMQTGPRGSSPPPNLVNPRNGDVAVPTGPNYTNTRDGTVYVPAGPDGVIDTRAGQFIPTP